MAQQNKVAVNLAQDFTDEQKAQARTNIGAAASVPWQYEELDEPVSWNNVGQGTWKPLKTFTLSSGWILEVNVQGLLSWTSDNGEALLILSLNTEDGYQSSPLRHTLLAAAASSVSFSSFGKFISYQNTSDEDVTLYLGAYNSYGIGSNTATLYSTIPSLNKGPNLQWRIS